MRETLNPKKEVSHATSEFLNQANAFLENIPLSQFPFLKPTKQVFFVLV
jgi:hypothetical protein